MEQQQTATTSIGLGKEGTLFSTLRQLKNYLRSIMTQERLNHVMVLHTHKDHTDNINLLEIAKEFVSFNYRRINFSVILDV